ncbi:MAG: metal-dependent hydrolase [Thermodesulfobacteriota bacterium]
MPGYRGHVAGGAILWAGCFAGAVQLHLVQPQLEPAVVLGVTALMGALFPDTDTDSKGRGLFYLILVILDLSFMIKQMYRWAAILGFCAMLPALGRHRGWTHTWWAMLLVPFPILLLPVVFYDQPLPRLLPFYFSAVIGYFSHILLDRVF